MMSVVPLNLGLGDLWPTPRGLVLGPRPSTAPRAKITHASAHTPGEGQAGGVSSQTSLQSVDSATLVQSAPDERLSLGEIEERLPQRLGDRLEDVKAAFKALDPSGSGLVTQGEFRRVVETFLLPLTQTQLSSLLAKVCGRGSGPVDYMDFLRRYSRAGSAQTCRRSVSGRHTSCMTLTEIQQRLKQKIGSNLKNVTRAFRLFDYNRDGLIQQHEFHRVLDNYCFPLTQREFQRLWSQCSPNNTGIVSYKVFLEKLGFRSDKHQTFVPDSTKIVLGCVGTPPERTRHRNRSASHNAAGGPARIHGLTAEQLQSLFLEKMRASCTSVRLALQAFDVTQSGRVSREDLRAILSSFLFPMSLHTFQRLTSCYGVRATGPVRWEHFLSHFTGPVREADHTAPQTERSPERPSDGQGQLSLREVYPLLQKVFHRLERDGAGRIARADLRRALEAPQPCLTDPWGPPGSGRSEGPRSPGPHLSPSQVRELLVLLDPEHSGAITQASLEQLHPARVHSDPGRTAGQAPPTRVSRAGTEETQEKYETQERQWIEKASSASDAWTTVQGLLRDKLCGQIGPVLRSLGQCDPRQTGSVRQEDLRRVILHYGLPLSHTHFNKLCNTYSDPGSGSGSGSRAGRVCYRQFLRGLGVPTGEETDSPPGTCQDPNTVERQDSHSQNALESDRPGSGPSPRSPEGASLRARAVEDLVFRRLRERMDRRRVTIDDRLRATARSSDRTVSVTDLKKLLDDSWITLDQGQFCELTTSLGFRDGVIPRSAFLAKYEENMARDAHQASEGTVGIGRAKPRLLTAEDCLKLIKDRIKNIHGDVLTAFRLMDRNCDGVVDAHDFRDLYNSLGLVVKEKEYRRLLDLIGLQPGANLNYTEFYGIVQSGETRRPQNQPANGPDQIHNQLVSDACHRWTDMSKVLCHFEDDGQGLIFKKDFRALLFTYGLPIRPDEFEELWSRYDAEGRGHLTTAEFLEKLGVDPEEAGLRKSIAFPTAEQNMVAQGLPAGATLEDLERVVLFHFEALSRALTCLDKKREGLVSLEDLRGLLQRYRCCLERDQFTHLLHTLNIPIDRENGKLVYYDFLKAFLRDTEKGRECTPGPQKRPTQESLDSLSPKKALGRMRELVTANADTLHKAFSAFDRAGSGTVTALEFRRVLDHFCARLSDPQFRYALSQLELNWQEGTVYWRDFLHQFPLRHTEPAHFLPISDVLGRIREVVSTHLYTITKAMVDLDPTHSGAILKEEFRQLCDHHFMRLTRDQFECVWNKMPVNTLGLLEYGEFLKSFSGGEEDVEKTLDTTEDGCPTKTTPSPSPPSPADATASPRRPKTAPGPRASEPGVPRGERPASVGGWGRGSPPVDGEGSEEGKLRANVRRRWREIQRRCREEDPQRGGEIHTHHFLDILQALDISVTQEELDHLGTRFDTRGSGSVSYPDFLRHFLLTLEPPSVRRAFERPKLPLPATAESEGVLSRECVEAMLRIYDPVQLSWKPMRRNFVMFDRNHSSKISIQDFRKVLRQFSVKLNEEELFHLTSFFDRNTSGKISYNDFLRAFLR